MAGISRRDRLSPEGFRLELPRTIQGVIRQAFGVACAQGWRPGTLETLSTEPILRFSPKTICQSIALSLSEQTRNNLTGILKALNQVEGYYRAYQQKALLRYVEIRSSPKCQPNPLPWAHSSSFAFSSTHSGLGVSEVFGDPDNKKDAPVF